MTLQNGMKLGGTALLWTDTAAYDLDTGDLVGYTSKAFEGIGSFPFAGTMTTVRCSPADIARSIGNAFPSNLSELLEATSTAVREAHERGGFSRVLLAVAERGKPRLFLVSACDVDGLGTPFEPLELEAWVSSHFDCEAVKTAAHKGWTRSRMKRVIETQVSEPWQYIGRGRGIYIGGNIVRLEVSARGVTSAVERPAFSTN